MIRIAICDDDEIFCHHLEEMIRASGVISEASLLTEVFFDGESLCDYIEKENSFDIIFLDIQMEKMDGVFTEKEIRNRIADEDVQIIYVSAKDSYAMELFEIRPMHFLIKPVGEEELHKVLTKALHLLEKISNVFSYQINRQYYYVAMKKIQYFEVRNRQIVIHMQDEQIIYYGRMAEVIEQVRGHRFLQISRSEVVSYYAIEAYQPDKVRLFGGAELRIGRMRQKGVQKQMIAYAKEDMP